jgi:hypothetical protein
MAGLVYENGRLAGTLPVEELFYRLTNYPAHR